MVMCSHTFVFFLIDRATPEISTLPLHAALPIWGYRGGLTRQFFVGTGTIPVDRSGGRAAQAALDTQMRVLRGGGIAGIYPEGTRSPDGRLYRGKTGAARLALETGRSEERRVGKERRSRWSPSHL